MIELGQEDAAALYDVWERTLKVVTEAEQVILRLPKTPERDQYFHAYGEVIGIILSQLRAPLVIQYPELDTRPVGPPDPEMDDEELRRVAALSESEVALIDSVLLAGCARHWRKVAHIVMMASSQGRAELREVPVGFFARRVKALVESGKLESDGNLDYMRHSEVRLPR